MKADEEEALSLANIICLLDGAPYPVCSCDPFRSNLLARFVAITNPRVVGWDQ